MNLHDRDLTRAAKREGILEGAAQKTIEAAINFYANGVSEEIIAKSLGLPLSKVSELLNQQSMKFSAGATPL
ncbi:hypothetical protein DYE50_08520 [Treponema ruminis]|uniref:DNA-binding transcriptional regulator LsrR (DeoR family) n=1 Tax=Treponema ruminis TaxID=744515 RepID=A0A7W8LMF4_9SPIR|nr:hypothetical protein [Treponema ruminis]MBB5226486.1 DNA-binding transcriptional regulator LsrR (DeoR family) [Treponema ruminis]QSI02609.1 hypothetical protein DYE50_08520 [Treponema ruminis]